MSVQEESGLRNHRVEFVPETSNAAGDPQTPSDPSMEKFADKVYNIEWGPTPGLTEDRGLGDADADSTEKGPEEHEFTVTYPLQRWLVDGSSNAQDAAGYGLLRDSDQKLPGTHTVVDREKKGEINANSALSGNAGHSTRTYRVARGAKISTVTIIVDPTSQQPVRVELQYMAEKIRGYRLDQMSSGANGEIGVESTSSNDTSQTLTVENEDASTTEDLSLNGTTTVWSTADFSSGYDVAELDAEAEGTIELYENDGTTASPTKGDKIAEIDGSNDYDGVEGDLGIPAIGSGSHASDIGTDYYRTLVDEIDLGGDSAHWFEINSKELEVDNNLNPRIRDDSLAKRIETGTRSTALSVTSYGETQSIVDVRRSLTNKGADITWVFDSAASEQIVVKSAKLTGSPGPSYEAEQTQMTLDETFVPTGGGSAGLSIS